MARMKPRIAVRALILQVDRLLLVNAYRGARLNLWCAPGGGAEGGTSLPDNLIREVHEETGLSVAVQPAPVLVNEFHDPVSGFHQVDIYFRCKVLAGKLDSAWRDPEGIVTERRFFSRAELESGTVRFKPDLLPAATWDTAPALYDPLEPILR